MERTKRLTGEAETTILTGSTEGTDVKGVATSSGRMVDTVKQFMAVPSPRKNSQTLRHRRR